MKQCNICKNNNRCVCIKMCGFKEKLSVQPNPELKFESFVANKLVNELYSQNEFIIQAFNNTQKHIDLNFSLPILANSVMIKFEASIGGKTVSSKIYSKEKGEEKFVDSISNGNNAFLSSLKEINAKKCIQLSLGNIDPMESFKLVIHTIEINESADKSLKLVLSSNSNLQMLGSKFFQQVDIDYNIKINTASSITRLISPSHPNVKLGITYNNNNQEANIKLNKKKHFDNKDLIILFRTNDICKPVIYEEKNNLAETYTYSICQMFDNYSNILSSNIINEVDTNPTVKYSEKFDGKEINDFPGNFYFLIDQSGSMKGKSIEIAKEALILFLKSLPEKSRYNIIGFGSTFIKYHSDILEYNSINLNKSISMIKKLEANLGGTIIDAPLSSIFYNNLDKIDKELPSYIFLLTDGAVSNKNGVINLIEQNNSNYTLTSIGIGSKVDFDLIQKTGTSGKGGHRFAINVSELKKIVIDALNDSLKPFMSKLTVDIPENISKNFVCSYKKGDRFIKQDEIFHYSFITKEKIDSSNVFKFIYQDFSVDSLVMKEVKFDKIVHSEGDVISKIVASQFLNSKNRNLNDEESTKLALNYQIISDFTSLFAECLSEKHINSKISVNVSTFKDNRPFTTTVPINRNMNKNILSSQLTNMINSTNSIPLNKNVKKRLSLKSKQTDKYDENITEYDIHLNSGMERLKTSAAPKKEISSLIENNKNKGKVSKISNSNSNIVNYSCSNLNEINMKSSKTLVFSCINDELFMYLIENQTFDGFWTKQIEADCKLLINNYYSENLKRVNEFINKITIDEKLQIDESTLAFTIFAMYLLEKKFSDKYDEFKLIVNKTRKSLNKKGISNDLIVKMLLLFDGKK